MQRGKRSLKALPEKEAEKYDKQPELEHGCENMHDAGSPFHDAYRNVVALPYLSSLPCPPSLERTILWADSTNDIVSRGKRGFGSHVQYE